MKKIPLILFVIFSSCQLIPQEGAKSTVLKNTTLQIQNKVALFPITEYIDGSLWEVQVYCFCGNTLVVYDIDSVLTGTTSPEYTIPEDCEKVKVSWKFAPIKSQYYNGASNCRRYSEWQQTVIKDSNTLLIVDQDWSAIRDF